jgi:hypothetical protein
MEFSRGFWVVCITLKCSGVAPEESLFHGVSELVSTYTGKINEVYITRNALRKNMHSTVVRVDPRCIHVLSVHP